MSANNDIERELTGPEAALTYYQTALELFQAMNLSREIEITRQRIADLQ